METFKSFDLYHLNERAFADIALSVFQFQVRNNPVYKAFVENLNIEKESISRVEDIPFLPISFFKQHALKTGNWPSDTFFESSGTMGTLTSRHEIQSLDFYLQHAERNFTYFFGDLTQYNVLALLPSYLERQNSSLVAMIDHFIKRTGSAYSGFYLYDQEKLLSDLQSLKNSKRKTILWGVTYALLDVAEQHQPDLSHCLIFETGGMKGRRRELTREELHQFLRDRFNVTAIYSEYGMTELLSQAYMDGGVGFHCPPWMKITGRDITDPFRKGLLGETSGINVIDLANLHSIAFLETEDLGRVYTDGTFEVLGRMDNSDLRGCNLMVG
ncbi:MAG: acyl transferase [Cyclobacteriaceae bacterium]|nr:acyl transferase [Cyclobacteriaceae bacterium]